MKHPFEIIAKNEIQPVEPSKFMADWVDGLPTITGEKVKDSQVDKSDLELAFEVNDVRYLLTEGGIVIDGRDLDIHKYGDLFGGYDVVSIHTVQIPYNQIK